MSLVLQEIRGSRESPVRLANLVLQVSLVKTAKTVVMVRTEILETAASAGLRVLRAGMARPSRRLLASTLAQEAPPRPTDQPGEGRCPLPRPASVIREAFMTPDEYAALRAALYGDLTGLERALSALDDDHLVRLVTALEHFTDAIERRSRAGSGA